MRLLLFIGVLVFLSLAVWQWYTLTRSRSASQRAYGLAAEARSPAERQEYRQTGAAHGAKAKAALKLVWLFAVLAIACLAAVTLLPDLPSG